MHLRNESIGAITAHQFDNNQLIGNTANAKFAITPYSDNIIRVQVSKEENFEEYPFSVIKKPEVGHIDFQANDEKLTLKTSTVMVEISQAPFRIAFYNQAGELLNADDPSFGISWLGHKVTNYKQLAQNERFIGLGEKGGGLDRRGSSYDNWNSDAFGFNNDTDPLYVSTPFFIGIREGKPYGIYLDNTHKSHFNFGASNNDRFSYFSAEAGDLNYYFIQGDTVADVIASYAQLTGTIEMPPKWSLGFQQCRFSYYPDHEIKNIADTFREKKIPADVIYFDIHYMKDYKAFTFDEERFPHPKELIARLEGQGFKTVVILDPGIATEKGYGTYDRGIARDVFVKYPDGSKLEASVWPGNSHFTDFTSKNGRDWWADELKFYTDLGIEGFWNDMNEPACWGQDIADLVEFDYDDQKVSHLKARNVYGYQMVRATYEGARKQLGNKRPFALTRSGFSGVQRYSAVWTGDNVAGDDHMLLGVRLVNSLGLTGIPVGGYDIGGFVDECSPALFARWLAVASFAPFFRVHSMVNSRDSEPWAYGEEVEEISRNYINLRYRLLPYMYTTFYEAHKTGLPINRSLAVDYFSDDNIYGGNAQNAFTLGKWLLVNPTVSTQDYAEIYLPEGRWYNFFTDEVFDGKRHHIVHTSMEDLPVFAKEGAIIPMQSLVQHTNEAHDGELKLHIYHGEVMTEQLLYEDDGQTFDFQQGAFASRTISFDGAKRTLEISEIEGDFEPSYKYLKIYLHGFNASAFKLNDQSIEISTETIRLIEPVTEFDPLPQRRKKNYQINELRTISTNFSKNSMKITW